MYAHAPATLTSANSRYRIRISEQPSVGSTTPKTSGQYLLYGNTTQLGGTVISGGKFSVSPGALSAVRPARADVSLAHVFPNPCNLRAGCNVVTFTQLTLNASISIYTVSGELVRKLEKSGNLDTLGWDLHSQSGAQVASGLYIYFIKADNSTKKGKLVIIR